MADVTVIKDTVHQDLKAALSNHKRGDKDLYTHVSEVMTHIVKHCPKDALNKVEEVSYLLKNKDQINLDSFLKTNDVKGYACPADEDTKQATAAVILKSQEVFATSKKTVNEEGEEVEEEANAGPVGNIPDIQTECKLWQWAGVSFGEYDVLLL